MVVRVAERALLSGAERVVVATDHADIMAACQEYKIQVSMTRADHPSGTDRIAEVAAAIGLSDDAVIVNVQGDEPLIEPELIQACAALISRDVPMATAAHPITDIVDVFNPNVVKVVLDKNRRAMLFSRAPLPWHRDGFADSTTELPSGYEALRHIGLYAYRQQFLQTYPRLTPTPVEKSEALEQLRVLWHGYPIAVHVTHEAPHAGVDTPEDLIRVQSFFQP
jgi:3-deoxy-manno-octulosonate cytidylyltransferase (CMP-KDO synthetase)